MRKHLHCRHLAEDSQRDLPLNSPCTGGDPGREVHHVRLQLCHWHLIQQTLVHIVKENWQLHQLRKPKKHPVQCKYWYWYYSAYIYIIYYIYNILYIIYIIYIDRHTQRIVAYNWNMVLLTIVILIILFYIPCKKLGNIKGIRHM